MAQENFLKLNMPDIKKQWIFYFEQLKIKAGDTVLDVGCNNGEADILLYKQYPYTGHITGIDKNKNKIEEARNKLKSKEEKEKITFKIDDALDLDFDDNVFSKVICADTLEWTNPPEKAIEEIYRVLKPEGTALIIHTDFDSQVFNSLDNEKTRELVRLFNDSGPDGFISRKMFGICKKTGFKKVKPLVYTLINDSFYKNSYSYRMTQLIKEWLTEKKVKEAEEIDNWIEDLKKQDDKNDFFYCINRHICVCEK